MYKRQEYNPNGTCTERSGIRLVIDSPRSPVHFTSCEISNDVNIKAHIENQPLNMHAEDYYAELNGTNAMIYCREVRPYLGANSTYNCSLTVPSVSLCSQGRTYRYRDNSFSVLISYESGPRSVETMSLTAELPEIITTQGVRTLYDITQEKIKDIKARLQETIKLAKELFNWYKGCMDFAKVLGYLMLVLTMVAAAVGAADGWGEAIGNAYGAAMMGTTIMDTWINFCSMISRMYEMGIQIQKLEVQMVKMEFCIDFVQHMFDTGKCERNEEMCFSKLAGCIDFGKMERWMSEINSVMHEASADARNMVLGLRDSYYIFGGTPFGGGNGWLYVLCNGNPSNECCSKAKRGNSCKQSEITVDAGCGDSMPFYARRRTPYYGDMHDTYMNYPAVYYSINGKEGWLCRQSNCRNARVPPEAFRDITDNKELTLELYCYYNYQDFYDKGRSKKPTETLTIKIGAADDKCECQWGKGEKKTEPPNQIIINNDVGTA